MALARAAALSPMVRIVLASGLTKICISSQASSRECRVFGWEVVARIHDLRAAAARDIQQGFGIEVVAGGMRRADTHGLGRHARRQDVAVRVGVHGHGAYVQSLGCADNPKGDFAALVNQPFANAARTVVQMGDGQDAAYASMRKSACPASTGSPSFTRISTTTPPTGASTW